MTHQNLRLGKCWKLFSATLTILDARIECKNEMYSLDDKDYDVLPIKKCSSTGHFLDI